MPSTAKIDTNATALRQEGEANRKTGTQRQEPPTSLSRIFAALADGDVYLARNLLTEAEEIAALGPVDSAAIRARIAQSEGDLQAARAILVMAIETIPEADTLRPLLSEILMADGAAGNARDVQAHLGRSLPMTDAAPMKDDGTAG